jgi:hypothetical protein
MDIVNFNEQNVEGTTYLRCKQIVIGNNLNSKPWVSFAEEKVITLSPTEQIVQPHRDFGVSFSPEMIGTTFNVIDPYTGLDTGATMTYGELFAILYSLYISVSNQGEE